MRGVKVMRRDGRTYVFDLRRVVSGGETDRVLQEGDVVVVPALLRPML
jgi:hypothetical protein